MSRLPALVLALALVVSCGAARAPGKPLATAAASAPTCAANRTAAGTYQQWQAKNDSTWSGSDQMTSYRASSGVVYWLTGDYISGAEDQVSGGYAAGWQMRGNTILMQSGCTVTRAHSGTVAVPDQGEYRHWAHATVEHSGYLYVLAQRVQGGASFTVGGVTIAAFPILASGKLGAPTTVAGPNEGPIQWAGAVTVQNGYAYIYGYAGTDDPWVPQRSYLARVPVGSILATSQWTFWDGGGWTSVQGSAQPVRDCQISSAASIGGRTVALCKPWHGYGSAVEAHTAVAPQGPFTTQTLFQSPAGTFQGIQAQTYQPMIHPWASLTSGKTLVSINRNYVDHTQFGNRADAYKPLFFEVTL